MRLHHLTATAFGPFAETVTVDFDDLGSAGLFLLTGPTGAGKSSVLDAVCFALYGDVPGDRGAARDLRSDHAGPDDEPRVVLTFSVGDRRLRLSRSPAWDRPKRRGTGTRRIQACVVAEEHRAGRWQPVSTRLDETGQLVGELLGMTSTQFTQVVLLPQGRFQTFLRASSVERHDVLKRLFRTRRYDDVERWLAGQRREAQRASASGLARCATLFDRLGEATGADLPTHLAGDLAGDLAGGVSRDLAGPAASDGTGSVTGGGTGSGTSSTRTSSTEVLERVTTEALDTWLDQWCDRVAQDAGAAREREAEVAATVAVLRARLEEQQAVLDRRRRGEQAQQRLAELDAASAEVDVARRRLERDAAARPVLPHARRHHQAAAGLAQARRALDDARQATPGAATTSAGLERDLAEVVRRHATAQGWLPREAELAAVRRRAGGARRETDELSRSVEALDVEVARLTEEVAEHVATREPLEKVAASADAARAEAERAVAGEAAAIEAEAARDELREVVARQQDLTATALRLRAAHLDAKQARIDGAASELAGRLAAGCSCPVCGSVEHPAPAPRVAGIGQSHEDEALAAFESAEIDRLAAEQGVQGVRARLAAWEARSAGHDRAGWTRVRQQADAALAEAERGATRLVALDGRLAASRARLDRATGALGAGRVDLELRRATLADLEDRARDLAADLADVLADAGATSVAALVARLAERQERLERLVALGRAVDEATATARQAAAVADDALAAAGFPDVDACLDAVLDDDTARRTGTRVAQWEQGRVEAVHVLADPDVVAALAHDAPPVAATRAALSEHVADHEEAVGELRAAERRQQRVVVLADELRGAVASWSPSRQLHRTLASLAGLVEGTSPDNRLRMRLTGYVLAERLRQVVAAANVRLAAMTDQRFALEHAEERGAGEQRGGLSLRVRDDWSGTRRDPATLSGGESFVVSLALALGLADTVAQEAGGTTVETLFVDEGFGSLDSDTLDAVMDVLDGLRDGGRVVGLVSHVAELRSRVPTQLEVRKGRRGSSVASAVHHG